MHKWLLAWRVARFRKPKFRKWAVLEDKKHDAIKAVEKKSPQLPLLFIDYISTALNVSHKNLDKLYWKDVIEFFFKIHDITIPDKELPLISKEIEEKSQKDSWDYSGRLWFFYSSIIAEAFGWSVDVIESLLTDEALAYIQEILTNKQLEREFVWSTTEIAYSYDKTMKQSKLHAIPRPYWMKSSLDDKKEAKKVRIPKSLLPMGTIIKIETENEIKKVKPTQDNENLLAS